MSGTAAFDLGGRCAVVIGASQGIGAAIGLAFAGVGAEVVFAARRREQLETVRDEAVARGGRAFAEPVDVSSTESLATLAARIDELGLQPAILVNCAGEGGTRAAFDVTPAEWDALHGVHLRGAFFACQAFGRGMAARGYGKIVNMSSTWAATVGANRSVYCAAKAGVGHMTAALAAEWAPLGIRVNALAPTATLTPTIERRLAQDPARAEYLRRGIPLGRLATTDDLVGSAIFLASAASDFVTGHTLFVDGGWQHAK